MTEKPGAPPQQVDLIINTRWLVPVVPSGRMLENQAVVVSDKRILEILPQVECERRFSAMETVTLSDHILIPGLINAHGHAPMSLFRGIADDVALKQWLEQHIWPIESAQVSEEFVHHGAELAIAEMLLSGTTCFADMYFFPDIVGRTATAAHMRVQLASPVLDFPTVWAQNAEEYIFKATQLHDMFRNSELVSTAFGPHAPYTVSDAPLEKIRTLAEELDIPIHMHVHETAQEVSDSLAATGKRPLQRLENLGLLSSRLLCIHATQLLPAEIDTLAKYGSHVIHCPESNLKLASGFCPIAALQTAGINLALGTDGCASNNDLDMFGEMRTAALLGKGVSGDATAMSASQTLEMATMGGARALGLDDQIGSIEIGKYADLTAVHLQSANAWPLYHPVSHLVYSCRASDVSHVWIAGKAIVQQGALLTLDLSAVRSIANQWQIRIANQALPL
ncbi:MAG: TRZ/ATZ family hydrolase [Pseudohongiellaceae bacterium]